MTVLLSQSKNVKAGKSAKSISPLKALEVQRIPINLPLSHIYSFVSLISSVTVAPRSFCSSINAFNAAMSCSVEPVGALVGFAGSGVFVPDGVVGFVGSGVFAGSGVFVADGVAGFVGVAVASGLDVLFSFPAFFTVTLHANFFFPTVACTLAIPFFLPLMATSTLPFFFKVMYFFPDRIFHFTFFLVFFTLSVLLFPFVTVIFLLLRLTFFAADTSAVGINPSNRAKESRHAVSCFFVFII